MASAGRVLPISKGNWESGKVYEPLDCVYHQGSTYICKATATGSTVSPDKDAAHWQLQAQGFSDEFITDALTEDEKKVPSNKAVSDAIKSTALKVTDTSGIIDGTEKKSTFLQSFLDKVGDWIINKAMTNEAFTQKLADNLITTEDGFALDAKQGKALADEIAALNDSLTEFTDYNGTNCFFQVYKNFAVFSAQASGVALTGGATANNNGIIKLPAKVKLNVNGITAPIIVLNSAWAPIDYGFINISNNIVELRCSASHSGSNTVLSSRLTIPLKYLTITE